MFGPIYGEDEIERPEARPENEPTDILDVFGASIERSIRADNSSFEAAYKLYLDDSNRTLKDRFPDIKKKWPDIQSYMYDYPWPDNLVDENGKLIETRGFRLRVEKIKRFQNALDTLTRNDGTRKENLSPAQLGARAQTITDIHKRLKEAKKSYLNQAIPILRGINPDFIFMTPAEFDEAYDRQAITAIDKQEDILRRAPIADAIGGVILGGVVGGLADPINLATLFTPVPGARAGLAKRIMYSIAENMAIDALQLKLREDFYKRIDRPLTDQDYVYTLAGSVGFGVGGPLIGRGLRSANLARASQRADLSSTERRILRRAAAAERVQENIPFFPGIARALNTNRSAKTILAGINKIRLGRKIEKSDIQVSDVEIQSTLQTAKTTTPDTLAGEELQADILRFDGAKVEAPRQVEFENFNPNDGDQIGIIRSLDGKKSIIKSTGELVETADTPASRALQKKIDSFDEGDSVVFRAPDPAKVDGPSLDADPNSIEKLRAKKPRPLGETDPMDSEARRQLASEIDQEPSSFSDDPALRSDMSVSDEMEFIKEVEKHFESDTHIEQISEEFRELDPEGIVYISVRDKDGQYSIQQRTVKEVAEDIQKSENLVVASKDCLTGGESE